MSDVQAAREGELLWEPSQARRDSSRMAHYLRWLERERGLRFADYAALHAFSVRDLGTFWQSIADYFAVSAASTAATAVTGVMPQVRWFEGAR